MKETIKEIKEVYNVSQTYSSGDGYEIVTNKQSIKLLINNGQSCCERWGYFWTNDKIADFVGAELLGVKLTDSALNDVTFKYKCEDGGVNASSGEFNCMFVDIETDRGVLQFIAYNEHNGYYSHEATVTSEQLNHSEYL